MILGYTILLFLRRNSDLSRGGGHRDDEGPQLFFGGVVRTQREGRACNQHVVFLDHKVTAGFDKRPKGQTCDPVVWNNHPHARAQVSDPKDRTASERARLRDVALQGSGNPVASTSAE